MMNLARLASGLPALIILDANDIVCYVGNNLREVIGEKEVIPGKPLPAELLGWRRENPWETEINGRSISIVAETWQGHSFLLLATARVHILVPPPFSTLLTRVFMSSIGMARQFSITPPWLRWRDGLQSGINSDVLPSFLPSPGDKHHPPCPAHPGTGHDQVQTYYNNKGQRITTLNSTIPLWNGEEFIGVLEVAKDVTRLEDLALKVVDLQQRLYKRNKGMEEQATLYNFKDIVGNSPALRQPLEIARRAARTSSPVLIYGETGTGKELVAQSIHQLSGRRNKPFIAQNCAALPGTLLEGILFGTVKGSFTGAIDRPGLIEQADGGTLLLDEINSMDIDLQAKLLRVLQEHKVRRVGGLKEIKVDVRIIATTNTQPKVAVSQGSIRQDLYYRLAVVIINLPPEPAPGGYSPALQALCRQISRKFDMAIHRGHPSAWKSLCPFVAGECPGAGTCH